MSVVTLRRLSKPSPELTSFREPIHSRDDEVVDLSALVAQESDPSSLDFGWIEIPVLGEDGRITGVLCRNAGVGFPDRVLPEIEQQAIHVCAHDLGNLLAVIDGGLRLLDLKTNAEDRALIIARLHKAVERGTSLSRRLLSGPHVSDQHLRPLSERQNIVDVSDLLDRTLHADVVVNTDIDPTLRRFQADPEQLHLALLNLCKNSSDAMYAGGTISITARNFRTHLGSNWVEITVADDGIGMRPDVFSRMFDAYFTTKEAGKGTGLGLAEVKRFVERSGGMVAAESTEDVGTTVSMFFPCD